MGMFSEAATVISTHLRTRDNHRGLYNDLDYGVVSRASAFEVLKRQFVSRQWRGNRLWTDTRVWWHPLEEGRMTWYERWEYPSVDLLKYRNGDYPYDSRRGLIPPAGMTGTPSSWAYCDLHRRITLPDRDPGGDWASWGYSWSWQAKLLVAVEAGGKQLGVVIPLNPMPWNEPRMEAERLKFFAQKAGRSPKRVEQEFLQELREPLPETGQRYWYIQASQKTTPDEIATLLVLGAKRVDFPVSDEDGRRARQWVRKVVRRNSNSPDDEDALKDLTQTVFAELLSNFDLPDTFRSLHTYIHKIVKDWANKQRGPQPLSGDPPYSVDDVVRHLQHETEGEMWIPSRDTLYDWIKKGHRWYGKINVTYDKRDHIWVWVTEESLEQIRLIVRDEAQYKRLYAEAGECMTPEARKGLFRRKKKPDGTPDWEAIEAHIKSCARKKGTTTSYEATISIEDRIAEHEARLAETKPGSDEWADEYDMLQQLRQMQQDPDT